MLEVKSPFQFVPRLHSPKVFLLFITIIIIILRSRHKLGENKMAINQRLTSRFFLDDVSAMLRVSPTLSTKGKLNAFVSNFKVDPNCCVKLFMLIRRHPVLPSRYDGKHLLWTLYFLHTYEIERRLCHILRTDRKTLRKYVWPTVTAISSLLNVVVSKKERMFLKYDFNTQFRSTY